MMNLSPVLRRFGALLAITCSVALQGTDALAQLTVKNGALVVKKGTFFSVGRLEIRPSTDAAFSGTTITRSATPVTHDGTASIAQVYTFSSPVSFRGQLQLHYTLAALNGANAEDLALLYRESAGGPFRKAAGTVVNVPAQYLSYSFTDAAMLQLVSAIPADTIPAAVTAVEVSGTPSPASDTVLFTVHFDEPVTGYSVADFGLTATGSAGGTVSAVASAGPATVTITVTEIAGTGTLRLDLKAGNGIVDEAGNGGGTNGYVPAFTTGETHVVDRDAPPAPSLPVLDAGSDSGVSNTDNITNDTTPTITGTAEAGSTVTLYDTDGVTALGIAIATGGSWSIISYALGEGSHAITARAADTAGNVSAASAALELTIDVTAHAKPPAPALAPGSDSGKSNADGITSLTSLTLLGAAGSVEAGALIHARSDLEGGLTNTTAAADGSWSLDVSGLAEGTHGLQIRASDVAGNTSVYSDPRTVVIDHTVPAISGVAFDQPRVTAANRTAVSFTLAGAEAGTDVSYTISSSGGGTAVSGSGLVVVAAQQFTGIDVSGLGDGTLTVSVTLVDVAGNTSAAVTGTISKDARVPVVTGVAIAGGNYAEGDVVPVTITLDEDVTVSGTASTVALSIGGTLRQAAFVSENAGVLRYEYTVRAGDNTGSGGVVAVGNGISLNGDTMRDAGDNDARLVYLLVSNALARVDTDAPAAAVVVSPAAAMVINADSYTVSGTHAENGVTVKLYIDADNDGSADNALVLDSYVVSGGAWSLTAPLVANSGNNFVVIAEDAAGNVSAAADVPTITEDSAAPSAPSVPVLSGASDTGLSHTDGITSITTPVITGTAEPNSTVALSSDRDGALGTDVADGSGNWSITTSVLTDGTHSVTATATDAAGNVSIASAALSITVDTRAPVLAAVADRFLDPGVSSGALAAAVSDETSLPGVLIFTAAGSDPAVVPPANIVLGGSGANRTVTVTAGGSGVATITLSAEDEAGNIGTTTFTVTVNTAPVITGTPATSVDQDASYSFTPLANDIDAGAMLTFSITNKPSWATFNTTTGELSGTPGNEHIGTTTGIVITVSDGTLSASLPAFDLTVVNVNDAPTITGTPATSVNQDAAYSFIPVANDIDAGTVLTFSIMNKPSWATFNTATGELSGTPGNAYVGTTTGIVITVSDGTLSASLPAFDLTVVNVNDAPTITGTPATSVNQDAAFSFAPAANDIDAGTVLVFSITNKPTWASFNTATGELSGTPGNAHVGTTPGIVITVTDGTLSASLAAFDLTVVNVNDAPTISGTPATSVNQDATYNFTPVANDIDAGTVLTFSITNKPSWATFNTATGELSGTPGNAHVGTTTGIVITVSDGTLSASLPAFDLTVVNVNDAPTITGTPATSVDQDAAYSFAPTANDIDAGAVLVFSITNKPTWATFNTATGELSGTPGNDHIGTTSGIVIIVSDGTLSASLAAFDLTVVNVNDAPTITGAPATSVNQDAAYGFVPVANDMDAGAVLVFSITNKPSWATFSTTTGELSGTPGNAYVGTTTGIVITVSDGTLSASLPAFDLTVVNVNDAPTITGTPATSVNQDATYSFTPVANDIDVGAVLTFSITNKPSWATFNTATGELSGTPGNDHVGVTMGIVITVSDGTLSASLAAFDLTVVNVNEAPTISGTPATSVNQDAAYSFIPAANDIDAGTVLVFSITNKPTWAIFNTTTGELSGTPGNAYVGTTTGIVITVSDGTLSASLATFDLTVVNVNDAPTITGTPATSVDQDATYSFVPAANDIDAGTVLVFSITNKPSWATFDTTTGELSGTPGNAHVGTTTGIVIKVSDGTLSASLAAFDLTVVNVNEAPIISGTPALSVTRNTAYKFVPVANDPDADDGLTFSITNKPSWANFDPASGTLWGTPLREHVGSYPGIVISVTDGQESVSLPAFVIEVTPAPVITGVSLNDKRVVFDNSFHSLEVTGALPAGATVSYINNSHRETGVYNVTAVVHGGDRYEDVVLTATLEITDAVMDDVSLSDGAFVYDGTPKSLAITGTLPEGTEVAYSNNSRTAVGTQTVTATISRPNHTSLVLTAALTITPATRELVFGAIPGRTYGDASFTHMATASTGEPVMYTSGSPAVATVSSTGTVTITGAGTATITATVAENSNYSNRPSVSRELVVNKASQTITFTSPGDLSRDAGTVPLQASSSSGLPVTLSVDDNQVAALTGSMLDILRLGTVTITATQAGDNNYQAAEPVTVTVRVTDAGSDFPVRIHQAVSPNGDGINDYLQIEGIKDYPENRLVVISRNGQVLYDARGYDNDRVAFRGQSGGKQLPAGTYFYLVEVKVNGKWEHKKGYFVLRY